MRPKTVPFVDAFRDVSGGNSKVLKSEVLETGRLPVVDQGQDLVVGYTDDETRQCNVDPPVVVFGDHTRAIKYIDFPFAMGADGTKVLKTFDGVDPKYAFYALSALEIPSAGYSRHFKFLKRTEIPLPPLAEQKRIARILDQAGALHAKRRETIKQLDALVQSVFLDMFGDPVTNPKGWDVVEVRNEIEFLTSGSRGWAKYYADWGATFIRIQNLRNGRLDLSDRQCVSAPESAEARRTAVVPGDVLVSITADLGRTAVVPADIGKAHINQHLAILRFKKINPTFASLFLSSPGGQTQFQRLNRAGVKAGLNFDDLKRLHLLVPPEDMQVEFENRVATIEDHKRRLADHDTTLIDLFASLQSRAFKGEL